MPRKSVIVTHESSTGRNTGFKDVQTGRTMTRAQFVNRIEQGMYSEYHVRMINRIKTPASNPDSSSSNNLG